MALQRFTLPFADVGGGIRPASGAKLFFYETGTSTLKNTFTDSAGATPSANPVIADSTGVFPDIFILGSYKVILKDKDDVQIWSADPVNSLTPDDLIAIARSLNVADSAVIYSTDTVTLLDNVSYIYDATAQTTWGVPALDSTGKTIVSVVGSALTTTGGTGGNSYTLENTDPALIDKHLGWVVPEVVIPEVDDTGSIQRALDTLSPVRLVKSTYNVSGAISLPNAAIMEGKGKQKVTINLTTASSTFASLGGTFNIRLKGFSIKCNGVANEGITLGDDSSVSAHHVIDDVSVSGHLVHGLRFNRCIYNKCTRSVYIHDGAGAGLVLDRSGAAQINGLYYNNDLGSVHFQRGSGNNVFDGESYNDVANPSDFLMKIDGSFSNIIKGRFEPQGAGNVRASILISDTYADAQATSTDNKIESKFIGLDGTTTEAHIIIGDDGGAFKTRLESCEFITLTGIPDVILKNQSDTSFVKNVRKLTYDTPTLTETDIQNDSGNPYYETSMRSETFLDIAGTFTPALDAATTPSIAYTNQVGRYTKHGNVVHFDIYIKVSSFSGGTGGVIITGLPFSQTSASQRRAVVSVGEYYLATSNNVVARVEEGEDYISLLVSGNNSLSALTTTTFSDSSQIRVSGTYTVA